MIPTAPLRVRAAATVICIRSKEGGNCALSLEEATHNEPPGSELGSDASARMLILFGEKRRAVFHSNWEVLMGQGEVQNWMRSRPGHQVPMRYAGEWKFAGGVVDPGETPQQAAVRELGEEFQVQLNEVWH